MTDRVKPPPSYGMGRNTANEPAQTADEAKQQAEQYIKAKLADGVGDNDGR